MNFADVLRPNPGLMSIPRRDGSLTPIYDEESARKDIKYFTRKLYPSWNEKPSKRTVDGIYVQIYQDPDYTEHMSGHFQPGHVRVEMIYKNGTNRMDKEHCHVICIRHMDITDEEIDNVFKYCRKYIENLNPENYRHKIRRTFDLEDVRKLARNNGLTESVLQFYDYTSYLYYLPGNKEGNWTIKFEDNKDYIWFIHKRFKVDPKRYYLHGTGGGPVYDLYEAQILLPRVIESYYDAYPKYLKMDLERTLNKLEG